MLWSCGRTESSDNDAKVIVVTVPQLAPVVQEIGGPGYEVVTVLDGNADPEVFEPSPAVMAKVSKADMLVSTGTLPFETSITAAVPESCPKIVLADHLPTITGTHGNELEVDPHLWASVRNMRVFAELLPDALSVLEPDSTAAIEGRMEIECCRLDSLDAAIDSLMEVSGRPAFGIWHPSLSYFARDYGLRQISVGAEHRELTPLQIRRAIDSLRHNEARVVFYEYPGQLGAAVAIAESAGAATVLMPAATTDSRAMLDSIAHIITIEASSR